MSTDISNQKVAVEVDASTLAMSSHGSITGVLAIRTDGAFFPEARWSDFPVVVLGWWLEPVSRILAGTSRVWECKFMDGPLSVRLEQQHGDVWTLLGLHSGRTEFTATVSCRAFIRSLVEAARQILRECQQRDWQSRDIETLDSEVRRIQHDVA
ncbi:MAG: hypothetical protein HY043_11915 [Verrucomicrobia bacterium]|nr:hypothetical protein [Verrucomicrobiota bacterium]